MQLCTLILRSDSDADDEVLKGRELEKVKVKRNFHLLSYKGVFSFVLFAHVMCAYVCACAYPRNHQLLAGSRVNKRILLIRTKDLIVWHT